MVHLLYLGQGSRLVPSCITQCSLPGLKSSEIQTWKEIRGIILYSHSLTPPNHAYDTETNVVSSKLPGSQESLDSRLVPTLDDNVVGESVDYTLLVRHSQLLLQSRAQFIDASRDLLDSSLAQVASAFRQVVDGKFVGRRPCDVVWKVRGDLAL